MKPTLNDLLALATPRVIDLFQRDHYSVMHSLESLVFLWEIGPGAGEVITGQHFNSWFNEFSGRYQLGTGAVDWNKVRKECAQ